MVNTTIEKFPKYTDEQLDMHVVTKATAQNLAARCYGIMYHEIEFQEDEPKVRAYADTINRIFMNINIDKPETMERVIQNLDPLWDKLSLKYILANPDGYRKL